MANANLGIHEDIVPKIKELRMKRKHQWLRLGLNEAETEVVVHEEGAPKSTWDDLLKSCPKDCASFLVWDDAPTNKVVGIYYSDDNLKAQKKMVGSAAWIQVRSLFEGNGIGKNIDAHDDQDMAYENISRKFK